MDLPQDLWVLAGKCVTSDVPLKKTFGWLSSINFNTVINYDSPTSIQFNDLDAFKESFGTPWTPFLECAIMEVVGSGKQRLDAFFSSHLSSTSKTNVKWTIFLNIGCVSLENLRFKLSFRMGFILTHLKSYTSRPKKIQDSEKLIASRLELIFGNEPSLSCKHLIPDCGVIGCLSHLTLNKKIQLQYYLDTVEQEMWDIRSPHGLGSAFLRLCSVEKSGDEWGSYANSQLMGGSMPLTFLSLPDEIILHILILTQCNRTIRTVGCCCRYLFSISESIIFTTGCNGTGKLFPHQQHSLMWLRHRERRRKGSSTTHVGQALPIALLQNKLSADKCQQPGLHEEDFRLMWICDNEDPLSFLSVWKELRLFNPFSFFSSPEYKQFVRITGIDHSAQEDVFLYKFFIHGTSILYGLTIPPSRVNPYLNISQNFSVHVPCLFSLFLSLPQQAAAFGFSSQTTDKLRRKYIAWDGGGFFCDEPGLGKTLSILSLVMKSEPSLNNIVEESHSISSNMIYEAFNFLSVPLLFDHLPHNKRWDNINAFPILSRGFTEFGIDKDLQQSPSVIPVSYCVSQKTFSSYAPITPEYAQRADDYHPIIPPPIEVSRLLKLMQNGEILTHGIISNVEAGLRIEPVLSHPKPTKYRRVMQQLGSDASWNCFSIEQRALENHIDLIVTRKRKSLELASAWIENSSEVSQDNSKVSANVEPELLHNSKTKQLYTEVSKDTQGSLSMLDILLEGKATLVVTPNNLLSHWESEAIKWMGSDLFEKGKILVFGSTPEHKEPSRFDLASASLVIVSQGFMSRESRFATEPGLYEDVFGCRVKNVLNDRAVQGLLKNIEHYIHNLYKNDLFRSIDCELIMLQIEKILRLALQDYATSKRSIEFSSISHRVAEIVFFNLCSYIECRLMYLINKNEHPLDLLPQKRRRKPSTRMNVNSDISTQIHFERNGSSPELEVDNFQFKSSHNFRQKSAFLSIRWQRLVVDEGHQLGTSSTYQSFRLMCHLIIAKNRWVVTGTPFSKDPSIGAAQLQRLLEFIRHPSVFRFPSTSLSFFSKYLRQTRSSIVELQPVNPLETISNTVTALSYVDLSIGTMSRSIMLYGILNEILVIHTKGKVSQLPPLYGPLLFRIEPTQDEMNSYNDLVEIAQRNLYLSYFSRRNPACLLNPNNKASAQETIANINLAWMFPTVGNFFITEDNVKETCEMLIRCTENESFAGSYNHHFYPRDDKRMSFVETVIRGVNNMGQRFVTPCDMCNWDVRFPIIVPCPSVHLICTECLIVKIQFNELGVRIPLTSCPLCGVTIHADFFDRLQPPVQATDQPFSIIGSPPRSRLRTENTILFPYLSPNLENLESNNALCKISHSKIPTKINRFEVPSNYSNEPLTSVGNHNGLVIPDPQKKYQPSGANFMRIRQTDGIVEISQSMKVLTGNWEFPSLTPKTALKNNYSIKSIQDDPTSWSFSNCSDNDMLERSSKHKFLLRRIGSLLFINSSSSLYNYCMTNEYGASTMKIIIVSKYWEQLFFLGEALKECLNISCSHLYPKAGADRVKCAIFNFRTQFDIPILLLHPAFGAHGLDLSFTSYVILLDPISDLNLESQVISRAHRVGANHPVYVEQLVIKDALEDQLLQSRQTWARSGYTKEGENIDKRCMQTRMVVNRKRSQRKSQISAGQGGQSHAHPKRSYFTEATMESNIPHNSPQDMDSKWHTNNSIDLEQAQLEYALRSLKLIHL